MKNLSTFYLFRIAIERDSIALKSAVLTVVYFYIVIIVHNCQQAAKIKLLLNKNSLLEVFPLTIGSGKTIAFENRWSRYKEPSKNKAEAYRVYVEHLFLRSDARDARIFLKEGNMTNKLSTTNIPGSQGNSYPKAELDYDLNYEYDPAYAHRLIHAGTRYYRYDANGNITAEKDGPFTDEEEFAFTYSYFENEDVYGTDYGFGLDAPKETEQANPQDLFAYRRNYTWNERNLLTKSSDRNFTVHYRYGDDGQRALKYTDEGRSETLYFNNFFTIHIPTQDQNNPQGLRVHKHIFVGNSRLVTAMTHTDNSGDNEEQKAKRYYYHADHLQSAQFVTDWKGRQYEHIEYTPYGELWIEEVAAGLDKLPFRFTGKEMDEETGLYYYGARYLDPKYSRWLSGDPALGEYIPQAPINDEAKKHNENLPDMGGVFNTVNLHVYHYAGNNPVKYTDPDGRLLINNVSENSASAREYERNHNLRYIAFLIKTLDAKGNAQIPIGNIDIILEKGLNKSLTLANAVKNNPNYVVDVKAIASETKNGNYQIDIDVLVFHYGADGKLVCDVNNSGTLAFADSSELGVFGPNSSIDQKLVNQKA
ncbi:RHS repeat domain-containing protein, partial [Treponema denticola]|uniref:RHS repeat domain-containing protein n=1 Tax=Treponema denticola TaxID=158 RepID=UPI003D918B63